jgi:peptide/nickel transport system permease protein
VSVAAEAVRVKVKREGVLKRVWRTGNGKIGLIVVGACAAVAVAAFFGATPHEPVEQNFEDAFTGPSATYWLGTDQFGRDVASRVMQGMFSSLRVAVLAVAIAALVGTLAGIAAGFFGKWVDRVIGRFTDILFAFPAILLALAIVSALGSGWLNTAMAIAVVYTPIFVRVARAPVLAVREADYVRAGRVLGFGSWRLLFRHVLPNVTAPIIVQIALALSWAILTESALSFLGLGTQPPDASLGLMVAEGRTLVAEGWWLLAPASVAIVVAVVGLNLLGDGLRDALDPTLSS